MRFAAALVSCASLLCVAQAHAQTQTQPQATQTPTPRMSQPEAVEPWVTTPAQKSAQSDPWTLAPRAAGVQSGPFTITPAITAGLLYDDNVFATNANRRGDWAAIVRPEIGFTGQGTNWAVEGGGFIEGRDYHRYDSENQVNGGAAVKTTVMPDNDTQLIGRLRYLHGHEDRGGGESLITQFDEPVAFDYFEAAGAFNRRFGRFWTSLGLAASWINYDTPRVAGVPVSQSYRDGVVPVISARFGYVVAPLTSVFVEWAGNRRDFDVNAFDSDGYRVVGGLLFEPGQGSWIKGEAYVGYMQQSYSGLGFQDISTWTYGGSLAFILAPRLTAVAEGRRQAVESILNGGVSVTESLIGGRFDYAVLPNFIVGLGATYLVDEFHGAVRTDDTLSPLVSLKYLVTPNITLGFDYRYVTFDSSGVGTFPYYKNVALFSINARL